MVCDGGDRDDIFTHVPPAERAIRCPVVGPTFGVRYTLKTRGGYVRVFISPNLIYHYYLLRVSFGNIILYSSGIIGIYVLYE